MCPPYSSEGVTSVPPNGLSMLTSLAQGETVFCHNAAYLHFFFHFNLNIQLYSWSLFHNSILQRDIDKTLVFLDKKHFI